MREGGLTVAEKAKVQVMEMSSQIQNENWGSFMIEGRISDNKQKKINTTARICIDAGSEAELITPAMVEALQLETI